MAELSHKRAHRVSQLLQQTLSELTVRGLRDPRVGLVTITEVRMSDDLRQAKVYVSSLGSHEQRERSLMGLRAAAGYLRREITERLQLRFAPMLHFYADETLLVAQRLEELLDAAAHGEAEPPPPSDSPAPPVDVGRSTQATLAGPAAPPKAAPERPLRRRTGSRLRRQRTARRH